MQAAAISAIRLVVTDGSWRPGLAGTTGCDSLRVTDEM
jgi:hypothetical protein